jgi:hypothetical protein
MSSNTVDLRERVALCEDFSPDERALILDALNAIPVAVAHSPRNYLGRIDSIWAALSIDDGGEGVCAAPIGPGGMPLPLIAADKRRLELIVPVAKQIARMLSKPVRLAKFTQRQDMEVFQP